MNEINHLMDLDPLELSAQDIDEIIAYNRRLLADYNAGVKPKKGGGDAPKSDLAQMLGLVRPPEPIKRRV